VLRKLGRLRIIPAKSPTKVSQQMNRLRVCGLLSASLLLSGAAQAQQIDPARIGQHVNTLASDAFEGRAPATPGEDKTVAYISKQYQSAGLQPGGDLMKDGKRSFAQSVPLARFEIVGAPKISVTAAGKTEAFAQGEQVALRATATGQTSIDVKNLPIVFVGYGVTAPERNWNDFKGMNVKGKLILVLVNDPDFETGEGDFGGKAMTYYGRWTYKYEEAARQGAAGILIVHETAPAAYGWAVVKSGNTNEIIDIVRPDPSKAHAPIEGWIQGDVAAGLLKSAGLDFATLKKQAQTREFKPVELKGVTFSTSYKVDARKIVSHNVVGVVPGTKYPDESIVYSAHWDHLGVGEPDAKGDKIYNGASDNATGTALLIELGRAFAAGPKPERSVVFVAVTAEEKGLLGSAYYAAHPRFPVGKIVADFNTDSIAPVGPAKDFTTGAPNAMNLIDDLIAAGQRRGLTYARSNRPDTGGGAFRSDHFSFSKAGVPALSVNSGSDLVEGGAEAKAAWQAKRGNTYHQPNDEIGADWRYDGIATTGGLLLEVGESLANSRRWPEWKADAEFKGERDKTASARAN
jgi:Zn-dependent M28 family amino/carboxypeptidase